jgi:hypothetical protein
MRQQITLSQIRSPHPASQCRPDLEAFAAAAGLGLLALPGLIFLTLLSVGLDSPSAGAVGLWTAAWLALAGGRARQAIRRLDACQRLWRITRVPSGDPQDVRWRLHVANSALTLSWAAEVVGAPSFLVAAGVHARGIGIPGWPANFGCECLVVAITVLALQAISVRSKHLIDALDDQGKFFG